MIDHIRELEETIKRNEKSDPDYYDDPSETHYFMRGLDGEHCKKCGGLAPEPQHDHWDSNNAVVGDFNRQYIDYIEGEPEIVEVTTFGDAKRRFVRTGWGGQEIK